MDFRLAQDIVDRLADALTSERRIDGRYMALEWIGPETREEVMRALYLVLADQYRTVYPLVLRADIERFDYFTEYAVGGSMGSVQTTAFPMTSLAALANSERWSKAWQMAFDVVHELALVEMKRWERASTFATWLKQVNPTYDDYLTMVNDHINRMNGLTE